MFFSQATCTNSYFEFKGVCIIITKDIQERRAVNVLSFKISIFSCQENIIQKNVSLIF